ncbi:MAG TPA: helix-turn-helix transcriptional regulator [Solirubrobacterales bacterium]|nr:helix-turn-helix transcriptional regulator [Solirubrobacterales bacterium]
MTIKERFAHNLRSARQGVGLTQEELAMMTEMHRTEISLLENAKRTPRLDTLVKLVRALDCPADELIEGLHWRSNFKTYGCWEITDPGVRL